MGPWSWLYLRFLRGQHSNSPSPPVRSSVPHEGLIAELATSLAVPYFWDGVRGCVKLKFLRQRRTGIGGGLCWNENFREGGFYNWALPLSVFIRGQWFAHIPGTRANSRAYKLAERRSCTLIMEHIHWYVLWKRLIYWPCRNQATMLVSSLPMATSALTIWRSSRLHTGVWVTIVLWAATAWWWLDCVAIACRPIWTTLWAKVVAHQVKLSAIAYWCGPTYHVYVSSAKQWKWK